MVQKLWKTIRILLKKLIIELPCDTVIPLPATYPKNTKTLS